MLQFKQKKKVTEPLEILGEEQFGRGVFHRSSVASRRRRGGAGRGLPEGLRRTEVAEQGPREICTCQLWPMSYKML